MKKKCKRLIALILVLSICFSMLSATAWAADVEAEEVAAEVVAEDTEEVVEEEAEEPVEEEAEEEPDQEQPQEEETTEEEAVVESDEAEETSISESITEDELETYADEALQIISALDSDSDDVIQVQVTGTYYQDDARSMLDMINEFRTGDDAWYWNSDNTTKTTCTNLDELEYNYELEKAAMLRAVEIALYFAHVRPNGESGIDTYASSLGTNRSNGENLAVGYTTVEAAFDAWAEADKSYSGQGHRRNMLWWTHTSVAIAHVVVNGTHCWVQEFSDGTNTSTLTSAYNSTKTVSVDVLSSYITKSSVTSDVSSYFLQPGNSVSLPVLTTKISVKDSGLKAVSIPYTWKSSNTSCVSISGDTMTANKIGTAVLSTTVLDTSIEIPITVTKQEDISNCSIIFADGGSYPYCGSAIIPEVTVSTEDGTTLTENVDYTLTCSNNVDVGTATVVITGIGDYTNSVTKTFSIYRAVQALRLSAPDLLVGETGQITSTASTALTYSSNNTSVVTVNSSGKITGKSVGTAVITVTAAATAGYYGTSDTITVTVKTTLATPSVTSITCTSDGAVQLVWNKVSGADEYWVYRKSGSSSWEKVGAKDVSAPSYTDPNVTVGTTYTYTVRCVNWDGGYTFSSLYNTTGWSITVSKSSSGTSSSTSVATPTLSSVSNISSGVKVKWSKVSNASGYYVYRKTGSSGSYNKVKTITSGSTVVWSDTSVSSGTTYYYYVKAYSGSTTSSASASKNIKYLTAGKISSLTNTSSGIKVKWSKVSGASGYYVYRKTSGGSYSKIATVKSGSTVSYSDTAVKSKNGTTYVYAVRPYSGSTLGSYTGKTTVRLTGVSISSLKNVKTKKMTVKWGKNSKATGYQIQYSTNSSFSSYKTVTVTSYKTISKTISSLTKGKKYYVRVRAYKTVSGTKYYSAWSGTKNVKISK